MNGNQKFFQRVNDIINGERENTYGNRARMFESIAMMWEAYKGIEFTVEDVSNMMALLKIARARNDTVYEDNYLDAVGYLSISHELTEKRRIEGF